MKWLSNYWFEIVIGIIIVLAVFLLTSTMFTSYQRDLNANEFADKNGCYVIGKLTNDNKKYIMTCKEQLIIRRFP
jgi:hypothetical protein